MSGLAVSDLHKGFGAHPVLRGVDLAVPAGSFTAILGVSGSGKTTLLRLLAGFDRPDLGTIRIGELVVEDGRRHLRPEQRRIGYVPQEGSLFPHLTVEANVGFGLRRSGRLGRVAELLELVGLSGLGRRYPHQLSGGQQQRVALARALAVEPEVVLLDEPFASLDAHMRATVRGEVRTILREARATTLLVTHDQDEALSLADLVAVLRDGAIAQHATPHVLYTAPVDEEVARFVGDANLLEGVLAGALVETPLGTLAVQPRDGLPAGRCPVTVLVRPEQILVQPGEPNGKLRGKVTSAAYHGHLSIVQIETDRAGGGARLIARTGGGELEPGTQLNLTVEGPVLVWPRTSPPPAGGGASG